MFPERAITSPIDEGGVATLTGRIATVLPDDTFFLEVNWGDGSRTETFRFRPRDPATSPCRTVIAITAAMPWKCCGGTSAAASTPAA